MEASKKVYDMLMKLSGVLFPDGPPEEPEKFELKPDTTPHSISFTRPTNIESGGIKCDGRALCFYDGDWVVLKCTPDIRGLKLTRVESSDLKYGDVIYTSDNTSIHFDSLVNYCLVDSDNMLIGWTSNGGVNTDRPYGTYIWRVEL